MYRDDAEARTQRASSLITEISKLEHEKLSQAATEHRLADARRELAELQAHPPERQVESPGGTTSPSIVAHVVVFGVTASVAYLSYVLLI